MRAGVGIHIYIFILRKKKFGVTAGRGISDGRGGYIHIHT